MEKRTLVRKGSCELEAYDKGCAGSTVQDIVDLHEGLSKSHPAKANPSLNTMSKELADKFNEGYTDEEIKAAFNLGVTPAKLRAMREYATELRRSNPKMKEARVTRKVCAKFKVELK